ncbi:phosphate signaling complex protein PhoU [Ornithinibacillus bavariensis]|uniref:Phosphate-specific transport system accessory protein PhoU n=1 Tax=Ornithinibacillus bavariensis TaxID=545502 RepID=A0A919XBH7_9BACI|nr:phosphate signaling complex protein PhoU [Ornithinibacillus bavariensis]GIO27543.1 phosphate transport system regulatory protein PhoU [Ornithinibacillus bavariensis]HAM81379.1 phosphate transport system regulatory protein PhoU [Ornithinibacillus sp.]
MVSREQFHTEMEALNTSVVRMAKLTERALRKSIDALFNHDTELARTVIRDDKSIDKEEGMINDKAILLIAKQQPVATDLRRLIIALRVVTDIERMGDNAKNIAKATIRLGEEYQAEIPHELKSMRDITLVMLETAISAFQNEDITFAQKLAEMDDKVDSLYKQVVTELLAETATFPEQVQYVMQIAYIARYLERFADHITNIGESILFLVKGEIVDLND